MLADMGRDARSETVCGDVATMSEKSKKDKRRKKNKKIPSPKMEFSPEEYIKGVKNILDMINRYWP